VLFKDDYLEPFVGVLPGYLKRRGISLETAREWELGLDRDWGRAIFVVRDFKGRLGVVVGRDVTGQSRIKYSNYVLDRKNKKMIPFIDHEREHDFIGPTKSRFLYGEYQAWKVQDGSFDTGRRSKDLIVVEGAIDLLNLWQMGWNVVAVLGSFPSKTQLEKLVMLVPRGGRLIVMADGDKAGRKMTETINEALNKRVNVFDAQLSDDLDPGALSEEQASDVLGKVSMMALTS
jgi:DNA primase